VLHPYRLSHAARSWTLSGWDETKGQNTTLRLDLIEATHPLPALFTAPPVFQMD
jgi:predicted DNA-binding transcriptional regulator YafY